MNSTNDNYYNVMCDVVNKVCNLKLNNKYIYRFLEKINWDSEDIGEDITTIGGYSQGLQYDPVEYDKNHIPKDECIFSLGDNIRIGIDSLNIIISKSALLNKKFGEVKVNIQFT